MYIIHLLNSGVNTKRLPIQCSRFHLLLNDLNRVEDWADQQIGGTYQVSGTVNDLYLQAQGTEGKKSYGMVVDLTVAYLKSHGEIEE